MSALDLERRVRELERRTARMIQTGRVVAADYEAARVRVQLGERRTSWIPFLTQRAGGDVAWWPPEVDEQVLVLAPNGDAVAAIACGSLYCDDVPAPAQSPDIRMICFGNGTEVQHDRAANTLTLNTPGSVTVHAAGDLSLTSDANVLIRGARVDINP